MTGRHNYWTRLLMRKTGYGFILRQMTFFSPSQRALWRLKLNTSEAILKTDSRPFVWYHIWVGFFVFLDITAVLFVLLFVSIPLTRIGVFFCLHSFSSIYVKMSLLYSHSVNNESNVDRMFLVFWQISVRPVSSLKFDCVILQVLPNRPTVLTWPGRLPTASFLARDYE